MTVHLNDHTRAHTETETSTTAQVLDRLAGSRTPALITRQGYMTGEQFVTRVHHTAAALVDHGAAPGQVAALLSGPNHPDIVVARYAARLLGATIVHLRSMNPRSDRDQFSVETQLDVLDRTGAAVIIAGEGSLDRAGDLGQLRPGIRVVSVGESLARPAPSTVRNHPGDCAVIDVTSGTTGDPRLVRQSHRSREQLIARLSADLGPDPTRLLSVTPVTHTTAPMIDAVLLQGGSVVLHDDFDTDAVLDAIESGVTEIYLAVPHLCALLDHPRTAHTDLTGLRRVIYSGMPAAPHRVAAAREMFGDAVVHVYGCTETGGISALTPEDHDEPLLRGTVGRPFPWVEVSVRDPESDEAVPPGRNGAIWVRSTTNADGYWADPGNDQIGPDGWFCTGDLGSLEQHGRLRLVGRLSGMIKLGGFKIYPAAVESALREHSDVSDAVVHGVRDHERRETVQAVVVPRGGASVDQTELSEHVAQLLSRAHAPTRVVVWHGVPLTQSGKPDRRLVRQLLGGG